MAAQELQAGRRILMVSMGSGGNEVATAFVDRLLTQCGVGSGGEAPADKDLADALTVFCDRTAAGRLIPRRLIAATTENRQAIHGSLFAGLYPAGAKLLDTEEFGSNNWAKGYQAPTVEPLLDMVRDRIAALKGECVVWLFHSLGGGYGAGAGSRFLEAMQEEYSGSVPLVSIALAPSFTVSDTVVQPYNAMLALKRVLTCTDQVLLFDNEAVLSEAKRRTRTPRYTDLNAVISNALLTLASPILWPDADGRRMSVEAFHTSLWNARPDATWKWASAGAPTMKPSERLVAISNCYEAALPAESDASLAARLLEGRAGLLSSVHSGQWLKMFVVRYGVPGAAGEFAQAIPGGHTKLALDLRSDRRRVIAAGGHTALSGMLKRLSEEFTVMYRRKAFLHWYTAEGIDEMEFSDIERIVTEAIDEIQTAADPGEIPEE